MGQALCPDCGHELPNSMPNLYCTHCGYALGSGMPTVRVVETLLPPRQEPTVEDLRTAIQGIVAAAIQYGVHDKVAEAIAFAELRAGLRR